LSPVPAPSELSTYYPSDYWHADEGGKITALEEFYRRTVLQDHVGFLQKAIEHAKPSEGRAPLVMDVGCGGALLLRLLHEKQGIDRRHEFISSSDCIFESVGNSCV